ncbi:unnamed protein product, partial [Iphiclides podalirius]
MDSPPEHPLLEIRQESIDYIRKVHNLDKPGRMKEAVNILDEWAKKQTHFTKKDFNPKYLETTIIACKGSLERAKVQLDKICTYRTLLPAFFGKFDVKKDVGNLYDIILPVMLPKLTADHYRVYLVKLFDKTLDPSQLMDYLKFGVVVGEYLKLHDYINGFLVLVDFREINIMDLVTKINPVQLQQGLAIYIEAFGMRLKGIHILTPSKFVDAFITILKQVLSEKISKRIYVHKTIDTIYDCIPKEILPIEYGGKERSLKNLHEMWLELLSSKEHLDFLEEVRDVKTDESCRQADDFNGQYAGMPAQVRGYTRYPKYVREDEDLDHLQPQ